jgi:hypothetical protein
MLPGTYLEALKVAALVQSPFEIVWAVSSRLIFKESKFERVHVSDQDNNAEIIVIIKRLVNALVPDIQNRSTSSG